MGVAGGQQGRRESRHRHDGDQGLWVCWFSTKGTKVPCRDGISVSSTRVILTVIVIQTYVILSFGTRVLRWAPRGKPTS